MNKITRKEVLTSDSYLDLIQYCAQDNNPSFNYNKALEECGEFAEVILKLQTKKKESLKGLTKEDAIEEYAHMVLRGKIALMTLFPDHTDLEITLKVRNYINQKLFKLKGYLKENKYKKGL